MFPAQGNSPERGRGRGRGGGRGGDTYARGRGGDGGMARGRGRGYGGAERGRGGSPVAPQDLNRAPRGICDYYWSVGACRRGFDCSFRHEQRPGGGSLASAENDEPQEEPDFFTMEGLTIASSGSGPRTEHNMRSSEVHNHLKEFLNLHSGPTATGLQTALKAQSFVRIFGSVNKLNGHWVRLHCLCFFLAIHNCSRRPRS